MKKILTILRTITLTGTSTTSLVSCNKPQYSEKELADLKEKNNIKTKDGVLEWMAPQEKPFNKVDNKWYYVVWCGDEKDNWRIVKFKYEKNKGLLEDYNNFIICINKEKELYIFKKQGTIGLSQKWNKSNDYFKIVYRWNLTTKEPTLIIDDKSNVKVKNE